MAANEADTWVEVISKRQKTELRQETRDTALGAFTTNTYFSAKHKDIAVERVRGNGQHITEYTRLSMLQTGDGGRLHTMMIGRHFGGLLGVAKTTYEQKYIGQALLKVKGDEGDLFLEEIMFHVGGEKPSYDSDESTKRGGLIMGEDEEHIDTYNSNPDRGCGSTRSSSSEEEDTDWGNAQDLNMDVKEWQAEIVGDSLNPRQMNWGWVRTKDANHEMSRLSEDCLTLVVMWNKMTIHWTCKQ
ncbi:hypothetical protein Scep_011839 [Stephania cephalantha]|uniref:Uncharacterized protein n=1 Tax=Stephania cephalantha TaxID=152367 RepID=A0AAP0P9B9_9MAGN